jgi:transcriptional regulator with XRE-family HTH domain
VSIVEFSSAQVGRRLAQLRDDAGLKQVDLARTTPMSASTLSRIESGERDAAPEELESLLAAIGTDAAAGFAEQLSRRWAVLPAPPLDHQDSDLLWAAEQVAVRLQERADQSDTRQAFANRLLEYTQEIERRATLLRNRTHRIAFVGGIGVGKSTAICKVAELEVNSADGKRTPVLETGSGGITLCEVHLRIGPDYGIVVEPRTDRDLRDDVADFADQQLRLASKATGSDDAEGLRSVSKELDRAIRNMSGLVKTGSKKLPTGERIPGQDPARELAEQFTDDREYAVEVLARMNLHRRDRRDIWWDAAADSPAHEWLKDTFVSINNGRHPEFTLPARIDIVVPHLMSLGGLEIEIVDTRGIDLPTGRADLESHLSDAHTVSVLCSEFNGAPEVAVQTLLSRATETGNPLVSTNACLLVLPKYDEALAAKDDAGNQAETPEEGYDLKEDQAANTLDSLGFRQFPITFFNSFTDDPAGLRGFLSAKVEETRSGFRRELSGVIDRASELLDRAELEEVLAEQREAGRALRTWLDENARARHPRGHVHDMLLTEIRSVHAATVHAAVRREGEWLYLSYSHQLGAGARRLAVSSVKDQVIRFSDLCVAIAGAHPDAEELTAQAASVMSQAYDELLRKMQIAGATLFRDQLQYAQTMWMDASALWGRGVQYRPTVASRLGEWFDQPNQSDVEAELIGVLEREWAGVCQRVAAILEVDD